LSFSPIDRIWQRKAWGVTEKSLSRPATSGWEDGFNGLDKDAGIVISMILLG
jgi:hypothetical protein